MSDNKSPVIANRYDFLYLFDVKDGNPNGDPDMANAPRFDPETFQGLVSDVCLKRKIRDYVFALKRQSGKTEIGYDVFVLQGHSLESRQSMPFDNLSELKGKATASKPERKDIELAREWMCKNFYDIRAFGAVMSTTDFNCGQVRGPVQITFARSIDRVFTTEHCITRVAYTNSAKQQSTSGQTEIGNKHTLAYGLYAAHGFVNPHLAQVPRGTGFSEADLEILWAALGNMFDLDRSASRGYMACRGLYIFRHASALGNSPAHRLFERIEINRKSGIETPRSFADYEIKINDTSMPGGVELVKMHC